MLKTSKQRLLTQPQLIPPCQTRLQTAARRVRRQDKISRKTLDDAAFAKASISLVCLVEPCTHHMLTCIDIAEYEDHAAVESSASSVIEQDDSQSSQSQDGEFMSIGTQTMGQAIHGIHESEKEVAALRSALDECWILSTLR